MRERIGWMLMRTPTRLRSMIRFSKPRRLWKHASAMLTERWRISGAVRMVPANHAAAPFQWSACGLIRRRGFASSTQNKFETKNEKEKIIGAKNVSQNFFGFSYF